MYKIGWYSPVIFTIGYEGKKIENFILDLKKVKIDTLVDVREVPFSRKKGFSKKALVSYLKKMDVKYLHMKDLGSPKVIRDKFKKDKDFNSFSVEYLKYLSLKEEYMKELHHLIYKENVCLMCYEKEYNVCHRSLITEKIKEIDNNGLVIKHL